MDKGVWIYDLEQFPNFHSAFFINSTTNEEVYFILHDSKDQREEYFIFLKTRVKALVGFNCINYDGPMLNTFINNKSSKNLLEIMYQKSLSIIRNENDWEALKILHLDLFKIHHYDNKARMTSLKWIEFYLRMKNVMDLPLDPHSKVTEDMFDDIIYYNRNDVIATKKFYESRISRKAIDLRKDISKEFGFNATNMSDVSIGSKINEIFYTQHSGKKYYEFKNLRTYRDKIHMKDCIPEFIKFKTDNLKNTLIDFKSKIIEGTKGQLTYKIQIGENYFNLKNGGIHSHDKPRYLKPKEDEYLVEIDVGSMYPFGIINNKLYPEHLGPKWLTGYEKLAYDRIDAKHNGNKVKADSYKLSLNGGGFGKTNDKYSWMYDPLTKYDIIKN
jgi:hypothetical protein